VRGVVEARAQRGHEEGLRGLGHGRRYR
jgi:hypothetical protein